MGRRYRAMVSSDWNECLAPCGPFDAIAYHYPDLHPRLDRIFRDYTGARIRLGTAVERIGALLPAPMAPEQMDAYLKARFRTYRGVAELMAWCRRNAVLFMVNTTGAIGYFQRAVALGLLPTIPVLSAHPMIRYPSTSTDPFWVFELFEIPDKGRHTAKAADHFRIPPDRILVMGDSGGDGPHFSWGASAGARLVGSMTKPSLKAYCTDNGIAIHHRIGHDYAEGEAMDRGIEMQADFMALADVMHDLLRR